MKIKERRAMAKSTRFDGQVYKTASASGVNKEVSVRLDKNYLQTRGINSPFGRATFDAVLGYWLQSGDEVNEAIGKAVTEARWAQEYGYSAHTGLSNNDKTQAQLPASTIDTDDTPQKKNNWGLIGVGISALIALSLTIGYLASPNGETAKPSGKPAPTAVPTGISTCPPLYLPAQFYNDAQAQVTTLLSCLCGSKNSPSSCKSPDSKSGVETSLSKLVNEKRISVILDHQGSTIIATTSATSDEIKKALDLH